MDEKYIKLGKQQVFRNKVVLLSFLKEYKQYFKTGNLTPSCSSCKTKYWNNYTNLFIMKEKTECDYILHQKYNGIQLGTNGQPIRNGEMTNEIGKELLENHPRGKDLFSKIPVKKQRRKRVKKDN